MASIMDLPSAWRRHWVQAKFRDAIFYVETDQRGSGRRVALHQYPKRNTPYAEDMGRAAVQIQVNGYVIGRPTSVSGAQRLVAPGRDYLTMKNDLIKALEQDGPGYLTLPMQHQLIDLEVMAMTYTVTESRERGGMCVFQMQFVEYGNPRYRSTINTAAEIQKSAATVENVLRGLVEGKSRDEIVAAMQPYTQVFNTAERPIGEDTGLAGIAPSVPTTGGGFTTGGEF
jgi:prophage DNA circulation protein